MGNSSMETYTEGLLWSELGDYVRKIVKKNENE